MRLETLSNAEFLLRFSLSFLCLFPLRTIILLRNVCIRVLRESNVTLARQISRAFGEKKTADPVFFIPRRFHKQYARVEQSPISKWLLNEAWLAEFSASPISRPLSYLPSQSREDFQSGVDRGPELIQKWINSNTDSQPFPTTVLKKNCFKKFNEKSN